MPKPIPLPAVIVEEGDTLRSIALAHLGSEDKWPILATANHLTNPNLIHPGDLIVVGGARPVPVMDRRYDRRLDGGTPWHY